MGDRSVGLREVTAVEQAQRATVPLAGEAFAPLPTPTGAPPFRVAPGAVGIKDTVPLTWFVIGDHGGIKDPNPQAAVSDAMQGLPAPDFAYSVGDVTYFNGDESEYAVQFYEPYAKLAVPIVAIPGNHDGAPDPAVVDPAASGIATFMANFASKTPGVPAADPALEYGRDTQTQPHCFWTLAAEAVTVIGLYSNVPSGGVIQADQATWLAGELKAAPSDRPAVVKLHHPPWSADAHHGGSATMGAILEAAFKQAGRWPELVVSGHVHDYQRFTVSFAGAPAPTTCVVVGNSGYHNLHRMATGAIPGLKLGPGVTLEAFDDQRFGFLKLVATPGGLTGEYVAVDRGTGAVTPAADTFSLTT